MSMKRFHRGGKLPLPKPAPPPKGTQHIPKPPPAPKPHPAPKPPPAPVPTPALDILKGDILQLLSAADAKSVDTRAAVGEMLRDVKVTVPHGTFGNWIESVLPFKEKTAQRSIQLADFKQREPALYDKIRLLGVTKAYVLITYPKAKILSIVNSAHTVPKTKHHKTPVQMSHAEMMSVISSLDKKPAVADDPIVKRFGRASRALIRASRDLIADRPNIDAEDIEDTYDDLKRALAKLAHAFDFDAAA